MADFVYARQSCVAACDGITHRLNEGDVWDRQHPLVRNRPELFADTPPRVNGQRYQPVEQASARPGERRNTRRG